MDKAKSPSQLATEFVRNNPALVLCSDKSENEVLNYVSECLALKRKVHLQPQGPQEIITLVGKEKGFAESPVGKLQAEIVKFLESIPGDAIGQAD